MESNRSNGRTVRSAPGGGRGWWRYDPPAQVRDEPSVRRLVHTAGRAGVAAVRRVTGLGR